MAFQIKDFTSIVASMINWMRVSQSKVTDFSVGGVARTLVEAPAVEIEELYQQYFIGLREAIPVATFLSFGFDRWPQAYAIGVVSISHDTPLSGDMLIPAGTEFLTAGGESYASRVDVTWPAGDTSVRIPVIASVPGAIGNVSEGVIIDSPFFSDAYTISNQAVTTGRDAETETERETRFTDFVAALSGSTNAAMRYVASQAALVAPDGWIEEYVTRVGLVEGQGITNIYLYSSIGTPSSELVESCQRTIDGYRTEDNTIVPGFRPSGVQVIVGVMSEVHVDLSVSVELSPGYSLTPALVQSLSDVYGSEIAAVQPGEVLYLNSLMQELLAVPGIRRIVPATAANISCAQDEVLVAGTLTVEAL